MGAEMAGVPHLSIMLFGMMVLGISYLISAPPPWLQACLPLHKDVGGLWFGLALMGFANAFGLTKHATTQAPKAITSQPKLQVSINVAADLDSDESTDASKESESARTRGFPTAAEEKQLRKVEKKLRKIGILEAKMQESLSTAERNKISQKSTLLADPVLAKRNSCN